MPTIALILGIALTLLGLGAWLGTGRGHFTALIPAAFGVLIGLLALLARLGPGWRRHSLHAAVLVALLAALGTVGGLGRTVVWLTAGTEPARPLASVVQAATAVLCIVFLVLAVRSFILARRARAA